MTQTPFVAAEVVLINKSFTKKFLLNHIFFAADRIDYFKKISHVIFRCVNKFASDFLQNSMIKKKL